MKDMSIYQQFCEEVLDEQGNLVDIRLHYPENFNFGYDVVDVLAKEEPDRRAIVWVDTENHERAVTFAQLRSVSNQVAHVLLDAGIGAGSRVIVALKRHVEYWFTAIALHKIGALMISSMMPFCSASCAVSFRHSAARWASFASFQRMLAQPSGEMTE